MVKLNTIKGIIIDNATLFRSLLNPSHLNVFLKDRIGLHKKRYTDELHAAIDWIYFAQDVTDCGGVSGGYKFTIGWREPYPETTGYIISTFLNNS